jgi:hypothetical protein
MDFIPFRLKSHGGTPTLDFVRRALRGCRYKENIK